ncbi:MAG: hypothetical protein CSB13_00790 [Chloroflexi bacterium]|nr:MAG: hypothetical protein CSB13_00790 [Chloroflexota bacterium]
MKKFKIMVCLLLFAFPLALHAQNDVEPTIVITEVYYNTPGDDAVNEWIEIVNLTTEPVDLSAYRIGDAAAVGDYEGMLRFPQNAVLASEQVVVVAQTAVSFHQVYGFFPDYEIEDTDPAVPDMRDFPLWSSGDLALANDGDEVLLLHKMTVVDAINYGDSEHFFAPAINSVFRGQSIERVPATCDTDSAAGWLPREIPTPGEVTFAGSCPLPEVQEPLAENDLPPLGEIQGSGEVSPYVNQIVSFRSVVTGIHADQNLAGTTYYTLFVQDIPGDEDGNPDTSDAIPVFLGWKRPFMTIGDHVEVTGLVTEYFGLTEIDADDLEITVTASDQQLPEPIILNLSNMQPADFETVEGMLVALPEARVIGPSHAACGFAVTLPDGPERIIRRSAVDSVAAILPVLNQTDVVCEDFPQVKTGDEISGLRGPLTYHFSQYKIVQQDNEMLQVTAVPRPELPNHAQTALLTFATINMENHFDAIDDTGTDAEPKPSPADIGLRQTKLAYAIGQTLACPTVVGVQEVEKQVLLDGLAEALVDYCGMRYTVTHVESADVRGIDVALLSDPTRVQVNAASLQQGCTLIETGIQDETVVCPHNHVPLFSRPPLQVMLTIDGVEFTVYVNHFKSKRGGERETAPRRLAQAQHLADLVDTQLQANADARIVVLGDFNDYEDSPPMQLLQENGRLYNTLQQIPEQDRYSYNFSGISQLIDGILVSESLLHDIEDVLIFHTNADYPDNLLHDTSEENLPFKATDHDLALLILNSEPLPRPTPLSSPVLSEQEPADVSTNLSESNLWPWILGGIFLIVISGTAVFTGLMVAKRHHSE